MKLPPPTIKRDPAFAGGPIHSSAPKTSATTEGGSKKRHFYKPLPKEFRRDGFTYRQIVREGDAAIYEQKWTCCVEPSVCYEAIRIRRREGFEIGGRVIEPAEVYPASALWGTDGFTFTNRDKAWAKFLRLSLEEPTRRGKEVN